jgi:two-component system response regulator YesN
MQEMFEVISVHIMTDKESRLHSIQLDQIRQYVNENFANQDLSLELLSGHFGLNAKYISKLFKESFGENFMDVVINLRVQLACKLLQETDESIQDIAERSGYSNSISFQRTFKKVKGFTPGQYRQQWRG